MKIIDMKKIFNERGFMLMSVIFLLMITSFAALIFLNGTKKIVNKNSALKIIALHLAEEQFAEIESQVIAGQKPLQNFSFLGDPDDLKNYYDNREEKISESTPIIFDVSTSVKNNSHVEVKVEWTFNGEKNSIAIEKMIHTPN